MRHVIVDGDGEAVKRIVLFEVIVNGFDIFGLRIFGGQAITATDDGVDFARAVQHLVNIHEQRFVRADFFGAIEHSDFLDRRRHDRQQVFGRERTVQVNFHQPDFLTLLVEGFNDFFSGFRHGTHRDDDAIGFRMTDIHKRGIMTSRQIGDFLEVIFNDRQDLVVMRILRFTGLEVHVIVFSTTTGYRVSVRVEGVGAEAFQTVFIQPALQHIQVDFFDFLDFVGRSETVKEVHDRHAGFDCG